MADGLSDGIENGDLVFEQLSAFAGGDPGDHLGSVSEAELCVAGAERAGYALHQDSSFRGDENGHDKKLINS